MDPDMEFNALAALSQSVITDMKQSFPAWEMVAQRSFKLSQQLRNTAQCLGSFCEALQAVSDCGSNLKGATRDVGACVTRVTMRQRGLESRFRTLADAFSEELARGLTERANYWKQRAGDLDKTAGKHIKKVRSRKRRPDVEALEEQRQISTVILSEQRQQFSFFISMLMPVLKAEMTLLDEGPHIHQAVDTLEQTVECVDSPALVETIVNDITQGADGAWKQCLDNATLRYREKSMGASDFDLSHMPRPISSVPPSENGESEANYCVLASKPPRRPVTRSNSKSSCVSPPLNNSPLSDTMYNVSQFSGRLMRPHSLGSNGEAYIPQTASGVHPTHQSASSCCSSEASAAINETLQHIGLRFFLERTSFAEQLGSDLENFCSTAFDMRFDPNQSAGSTGTLNGGNNIRMRPSEHKKPPPPIRRNSTITAATPTAPSVADARHNYMMGSRQSLNSSTFSGSTTDLHQPHPSPANVNPYAKTSTFQPKHYNI